MFSKRNKLQIYLLFVLILISIIGYNLQILQSKKYHREVVFTKNVPVTITATSLVPTIEINTPPTTPMAPTTTQPLQIYESDFKNNEVRLLIPKIFIDTHVDISQTIQIGSNLTLSEPKELPLWIATWSVEPGLEGVSMIYGHRQWGPNPKVFSALDQLSVGDKAHLSNSTHTFIYTVNESIVIDPDAIWLVASDHNQRNKENHQNELMLITCTPWGTNLQRLIIFLTLESVNVLSP